MTSHQEAKELLQPIVDLFSGADGGAAFARLRHDFLPQMIEKAEKDSTAAEFVTMVERLSKLCNILMGQK